MAEEAPCPKAKPWEDSPRCASSYAASGQTGSRTVTVGTSGTASFTVVTVDDARHEPGGEITATVVSAGGGYEVRPPGSAAVGVKDDDHPGLSYTIPGVSAKAGVSTAYPGERVYFSFELQLEKDGNGNDIYPAGHPRRFSVGAQIESSVRGVIYKFGFSLGKFPDDGLYAGKINMHHGVRVEAQAGETLTARALPGYRHTFSDGTKRLAYQPLESATVKVVPRESGAGAEAALPPTLTIAADAAEVTEGGTVSFTLSADPAPTSRWARAAMRSHPGASRRCGSRRARPRSSGDSRHTRTTRNAPTAPSRRGSSRTGRASTRSAIPRRRRWRSSTTTGRGV